MPMTNPRFPNFMLIGAAKAGTTSLHHYLSQHPQVFLPVEKELQFFTDNELFQKELDFYLRSYFSGSEAFVARGEATPFYLHRPEIVIPRLKQFFPSESMKFIVILRDPVKRAWSHYQHMVRLGQEPLSFEDALEAEAGRLLDEPTSWYSYFSDGLYCKQLEIWFSHFPREHFMIIRQEQLEEGIHQVLVELFRFLGVDESVVISDTSIKNEAGEPRSKLLMKFLMGKMPGMKKLKGILPIIFRRRLGMRLRQLNIRPVSRIEQMDPEMSYFLKQKYTSDIECLEVLLHSNFSSWKGENTE